jgi:hypothetical protein
VGQDDGGCEGWEGEVKAGKILVVTRKKEERKNEEERIWRDVRWRVVISSSARS